MTALRLVERTRVCSNPDCPRAGMLQPWSNFNPRAYWDDGTIRLVHSKCRVCAAARCRLRRATKQLTDAERDAQRAKAREQYAARMADPNYATRTKAEKAAAYRLRWKHDPAYRARNAAHSAAYARRLASDPDRRERALARRRAKRAQRNEQIRREASTLLPIEPFSDWIGRELRVVERGLPDGDERGAQTLMADRGGIDARRLYAWRHENKTIALDVLDAFACRYGEPTLLADLYPDLYAFEDEAA